MAHSPLWKYCTAKHRRQILLDLNLLDRSHWPDDKYIACLYALSNHPGQHYRSHQIAKRDGTTRQLYEPDPLLKHIQRQILHNVLEQMPVSDYATAYRKKTGIREHAFPHIKKQIVLKLDIENFFDHVMFHMVYQYAFPAVSFPPQIRSLLAHLCCRNESLPQGAPTSAYISNLVLRSFDESLGTWCAEREITYTRYCDDITCSGTFNPHMVIRKVAGYLQELGFYLKDEKTSAAGHGQRQVVTGITVNEKPQVPREYRSQLRKELYYCRTYGVQGHLQYIGDTVYLPEQDAGIRRYLLSLLGRINFVLYVNPDDSFFTSAAVEVKSWLKVLYYNIIF